MSTVRHPHIEIRNGMPYIAGTPYKVVMLVLEHLVHNWDANEIQRQHAGLSLAQIHGAFAYYYDHQEELDTLMEQRRERSEKILRELGESPVRAKLEAMKRGSQH